MKNAPFTEENDKNSFKNTHNSQVSALTYFLYRFLDFKLKMICNFFFYIIII